MFQALSLGVFQALSKPRRLPIMPRFNRLGLLAVFVMACAQTAPPTNTTSRDGAVIDGPVCSQGWVACGGVCVDQANSPEHCGGCGRACAAGSLCLRGVCSPTTSDGGTDGMTVPLDASAPDGMMVLPDGMMVPLDASAPPMDLGPTCVAGQIECGGACVSFLTDERHCGGCNLPCATGQACMAGACTGQTPLLDGGSSCGMGLTLCMGFCVNTALNASHCGACGNACSAGRACVAGACATGADAGVEVTCPTGLVQCGPFCVDINGSAGNCGACGRQCPVGQVCGGGVCVTLGPTDAGTVACPAGQVRCVDRCVDLTVDPGHCGGCGNSCPIGTLCMGGTCRSASMMPPGGGDGGSPCPSGLSACGGGCIDTSRDPTHCGRCGNACALGSVCTRGACVSAGCMPGWGFCNDACIDVQRDANNCGSCGRACPSGQACSAGSCVTSGPCMAGFTMCSGGACIDVQRDANNCGSCGRACPSGQACSAGSCGPSLCPMGGTRCGTDCVDLTDVAAHCGACFRACPTGQVCRASACVPCAAGLTFCVDPEMVDSACFDLQTAPQSCGACGRSCPSSAPRCVAGVCRS